MHLIYSLTLIILEVFLCVSQNVRFFLFTKIKRVTQVWSLFFNRIHFEKLKKIPVLYLDATVKFQSDPEVQEQLVTKVICCKLFFF